LTLIGSANPAEAEPRNKDQHSAAKPQIPNTQMTNNE